VNWRCVNVRLQGTGHISSGLPCQDFSLCKQFPIKEAPVLISLVADGAGSASDGGSGAQIACEAIALAIRDWVDEWEASVPAFTDELVRGWIQKARDRVIAAAEVVGKSPMMNGFVRLVATDIARDAFGEEFGNTVLQIQQETRPSTTGLSL